MWTGFGRQKGAGSADEGDALLGKAVCHRQKALSERIIRKRFGDANAPRHAKNRRRQSRGKK
jgi:hypothetical protein